MKLFWDCFVYLAIISIALFFVGRLLPKKWFCPEAFPYRTYRFEKDGGIYLKLNIKSWQHRLPDMSRIFTKWFLPKKIDENYRDNLPLMIRETCIAECIHTLEAFLGLYCIVLWTDWGGVILSLLYALGNIPFIMIQRYNRPRLMRLWKKQQMMIEIAAKKEACAEE